MALHALEGKISDEDYSAKADLETRVVLQRHLIGKLGGGFDTAPVRLNKDHFTPAVWL